jgi:hypothetical protein
MKLKEFDAQSVSLILSLDELVTMAQALNEVCNGLRVVDFHIKMGSDEIETLQLLEGYVIPIYKKMKKSGNQDVVISFSRRELRAVIGAFEEVCKEIDAIEFATRMGAQRSEVDQILDEIVPIYHQMKLI